MGWFGSGDNERCNFIKAQIGELKIERRYERVAQLLQGDQPSARYDGLGRAIEAKQGELRVERARIGRRS